MAAVRTAIPDHVAAYAAALRVRMSWLDVATVVELAGLGRFHWSKLAAKAQAWERKNLKPGALHRVRELGFDLRHGKDVRIGIRQQARRASARR